MFYALAGSWEAVWEGASYPVTLPGTLDENNIGYADSGEDCLTCVPGVFVAGDLRVKSVRQLTTATSDGAVAALAACSYLDSLGADN